MASKIARGVTALITTVPMVVFALMVILPTAPAAASGTVQRDAWISAVAPHTADPVLEKAVNAVVASPLSQASNSTWHWLDHAAVVMRVATPSLTDSIFADAVSSLASARSCIDIIWYDY